MNRQERRKREREAEKDINILRKLPEREVIKINQIINKVAESKSEEALNLIDRSFSAVLVSEGWTFKEVKRIQDLMAEFMIEDQEKIKILEKEKVDMAKLQAEVREFMEGLIKNGKGRKEVVEETMFKFPKLSKTAANNAFGKIQEEYEIEDAAAYILEDNKEIKKVVEKEDAKKIAKDLEKAIEKEVNEEKEMVKEKGLEIIEEVVVKTVKAKGNNGVYEAKTGVGVALENEGYKIAFKNVSELEAFCNEFKKMFGVI